MPIAAVVVALVVYVVRSRPEMPAPVPGPKVMLAEMGPAPALSLEDLNGDLVSLSDYRGKVVLVNLWATWCPWCRQEIPELIDLSARYTDQGFVVLGVAIDDEGKEVVAPDAEAMGMNYPVLVDPGAISSLKAGWPLSGALPQSFLIDCRGHVRASMPGYRPRPVIEEAVLKLLAEVPGCGHAH